MKYNVVRAYSLDVLIEIVNKQINDHYILIGGIACNKTKISVLDKIRQDGYNYPLIIVESINISNGVNGTTIVTNDNSMCYSIDKDFIIYSKSTKNYYLQEANKAIKIFSYSDEELIAVEYLQALVK